MSNLKLGKLPDRTPAKITFTVGAELNRALRDYAAIYRETYGEAESVAELVPFMLEAFLESDRAFVKARKERLQDLEAGKPPRARLSSRSDSEKPSPGASFDPRKKEE